MGNVGSSDRPKLETKSQTTPPPQKKIISFHLRVATNSNTGQNVHSVIKSVKETSRMTGL